jgi:hypothetical protein
MTTIASAISRIKRDLRRSYKEPINTLAATLTTTATTITLSRSLNTLTADSVAEIGDELVYVFATNTGALTVTDCSRAFDGTTAVQHTAGTLVRPNPRFTTVDVRDAIAEEIRSWEPRLFQVSSVTESISSNSGTRAWDFTDSANFLGRIISVEFQPATTAYWNYPFPDSRPIKLAFARIAGGQDTTTFASGWALVVSDGQLPTGLLPAGTVTVRYAARFDLSDTSDSVDLETTVGIPASSLALLRYGVMWRLLAAQEAQRTDTSMQDEPRRSDEVKPGDVLRTAAGYKQLRDEMLTIEADKLNALHGASGW